MTSSRLRSALTSVVGAEASSNCSLPFIFYFHIIGPGISSRFPLCQEATVKTWRGLPRAYTRIFLCLHTPFLRPSLETFFAHLSNASSYALLSASFHSLWTFMSAYHPRRPCFILRDFALLFQSLSFVVILPPFSLPPRGNRSLPKSQHHHPSSANPQNAAPATSTPIALPHALRPQPTTARTASILARHHQRQRRPQR